MKTKRDILIEFLEWDDNIDMAVYGEPEEIVDNYLKNLKMGNRNFRIVTLILSIWVCIGVPILLAYRCHPAWLLLLVITVPLMVIYDPLN